MAVFIAIDIYCFVIDGIFKTKSYKSRFMENSIKNNQWNLSETKWKETVMTQQSLAEARISFIEQLHQEFMAEKGYGAYVYLTSYGAVMLFNQFLKQQHKSEKEFIRAYVSNFVRSKSDQV